MSPNGFTVAEFAARVYALTGVDRCGYSTRQAAYDLPKLRGKQVLDKPGRTRRYHLAPPAARTIAALLTLRDQVIAPILAAVRSPRMRRKPAHWTASTVTTNESASTCKPYSPISPSKSR